MNTSNRHTLSLLLVFFLGYLGFSLVLPIFPPLFLDAKTGFFSPDMSQMTRTLLLGLLICLYPLGQLVGAPILGKLSDHYGRRPMLMISLFGIIPSYFLSGVAIHYDKMWLLFLSRWITGLFEGNVVIASAAMADVSKTNDEKVKKFGWLFSVSCLGFIIGPLLGGKLTDSTIVPWFSYSTPFWVASLMVIIALLVVHALFDETLDEAKRTSLSMTEILSIFPEVKSFAHLSRTFVGNFFLYSAFFSFLSFFPVFLVKMFAYGPSKIAEMEAYLAVPICLAPLLYNHVLKKISPQTIISVVGLFFGAGVYAMLLFRQPVSLYFTLIVPGLSIAIGFIYTVLVISNAVSEDLQGQALGINQSVMVLAEIFTAIIGGVLASIEGRLPLYVAAAFAVVSALLIHLAKRKLRA